MTSPVLRSPSNCASLILAAALGNVSPPMAPASSVVSLHQISGPEALPHTDSPARNQDDDWQLALLSPCSTLSDIWRAYAHNIRLIRKHQDAHPSSDDADDDDAALTLIYENDLAQYGALDAAIRVATAATVDEWLAAGAGLRLRVELSHCSITMVDPRVPVIADADTGVAMCACTTTMCARTGVAGLLIEDPVKQKRLVPLDEYLVRIHAALGSKIILITRSDALAPFGLRLSRTCGPVPDVVTSPTPSLTEQCGMQRRGQSSLTRTYRARSRSPNEYLVGALPTSLPPGAVLRKYAARRGLTAFPSFVESSEADLLAIPSRQRVHASVGNAPHPPPRARPLRCADNPKRSRRRVTLASYRTRLSGGTTSQTQMQLSPARVLWGERKADVQAGDGGMTRAHLLSMEGVSSECKREYRPRAIVLDPAMNTLLMPLLPDLSPKQPEQNLA
ncbi:hypothetical protein B0H10DRAFT_2215774 [Mycena sp. CBHHK59/15]|nr:hypothetical protein B0H10DRAFT_2215774 [Mycena sp. CBHHK59/15]